MWWLQILSIENTREKIIYGSSNHPIWQGPWIWSSPTTCRQSSNPWKQDPKLLKSISRNPSPEEVWKLIWGTSSLLSQFCLWPCFCINTSGFVAPISHIRSTKGHSAIIRLSSQSWIMETLRILSKFLIKSLYRTLKSITRSISGVRFIRKLKKCWEVSSSRRVLNTLRCKKTPPGPFMGLTSWSTLRTWSQNCCKSPLPLTATGPATITPHSITMCLKHCSWAFPVKTSREWFEINT